MLEQIKGVGVIHSSAEVRLLISRSWYRTSRQFKEVDQIDIVKC
jgi:hypothetical protein